MRFISVGVLLGFVVSSCGSSIGRRSVDDYHTPVIVEAPIGVELEARAGERLFVRGALYEVQAWALDAPIDSEMPGFMAVPFRFRIEEGELALRFQSRQHLFYHGPAGGFEADWDGASVIRDTDTVGIRESKATGELEWYVDNSVHNHFRGSPGDWIWHRKISDDDHVAPVRTTVTEFDLDGVWMALYYAGFYDGKLHFELEEQQGANSKRSREFQFNLDGVGPTRVGVRGLVLEVLAVDNVSMSYRWVEVE